MTAMTTKQREALKALETNAANFPRTDRGGLKTGINTAVLSSLQKKGLIRYSTLCLGGIVYDLEVVK